MATRGVCECEAGHPDIAIGSRAGAAQKGGSQPMPLTPFFGRCLRPYLCLYLCLLRLRSLLGMARCAGRRITVGKSVSAPVHRGDRFVRVARFHECHKAEAAQLASLAIHRQVDIFDLAELGEIFLYVALLDAKRDPTHEHLAALAIVSWPACGLVLNLHLFKTVSQRTFIHNTLGFLCSKHITAFTSDAS